MSSWVQPYMEYEPVEEEEFNAEDFEEAIDAMSQNIDNILETASANIGIDITLLSFIVSAIASVVGFCIYKWKPEVVTCCDIECASETETVAGSSAPVNAEVIELTNVGTKQKGAKEPEIANARELTDDEFLNRPETPSASVSLLTEVTPKRKRTPIARSISSSSATPGPSTPPIKPRIVKSRVPPYRSLANKNRKSPVHNKRKSFIHIINLPIKQFFKEFQRQKSTFSRKTYHGRLQMKWPHLRYLIFRVRSLINFLAEIQPNKTLKVSLFCFLYGKYKFWSDKKTNLV